MNQFRKRLQSDPTNTRLQQKLEAAIAQYEIISARNGGYRIEEPQSAEPDRGLGGTGPTPPPNCVPIPTTASNMTPVAIPDNNPTGATSTINVAGAGPYLWDVDVTTFITHTWNSDLDITITSPAGTVVSLSTDNAGSNDNVYNGTVWDDDAGTTNPPGAVTDTTFANNVVETPLVPEEALGAFIGEDPNGTWTLLVVDQATGDTGNINSWSLDIDTCTCMEPAEECMIFCPANVAATATDPTGAVVNYPAPTTTGDCGPVTCVPASGSFFPVGTTAVTCTAATQTPTRGGAPVTMTYSSGAIANPIPDVGMTMQTITVPDMGTVTDVDVRVRINHAWDEDLDISLMGPNGVTIDLSSDNGGSADNYGSGATDCTGTPTVFDDEAGTPITSGTAPFAASFQPEQALTAFDGIDAAGDWKLIVGDDEALLTGTLFCYELVITREVGGGGGGTSCSFNVTVSIPFDSVCVDDATCDTFSTVVNVAPSSPLYGFWQYTVAATGEVFSGTANTVSFIPNRSLTMGDNVTPTAAMQAQIDFARRTCTARVTDRATGRTFVLRDRNITLPNPNCGMMTR